MAVPTSGSPPAPYSPAPVTSAAGGFTLSDTARMDTVFFGQEFMPGYIPAEGVVNSGGDSLAGYALPQDVFGPESYTTAAEVQQTESGTYGSQLCHGIIFQSSVLAMGILYCIAIYYFRHYAISVFRLLRSNIYTEKLLGEANHTFNLFLTLMNGLGIFMTGIAAVKMFAVFAPVESSYGVEGWMAGLAVPLAVAVTALIEGYRWAAIKLTGSITLSKDFTNRLWVVRKMIVAIATLFIAPLLLLAALNAGPCQIAMAWIVAAGFVAAALILLLKTYALFVDQNVSILHWILYLCAVEFLPVSLIAGLAVRIAL